MRGRFTLSKFQMNLRTLGSARNPCGSVGLNVLTITRHIQNNLERSNQITRVARGKRRSKAATAKFPSLIQLSPACNFSIKLRNTDASTFVQCCCQISSRLITAAPVRSPSCRAKVVFPVPAQPKITIRGIFAQSRNSCGVRSQTATRRTRAFDQCNLWVERFVRTCYFPLLGLPGSCLSSSILMRSDFRNFRS